MIDRSTKLVLFKEQIFVSHFLLSQTLLSTGVIVRRLISRLVAVFVQFLLKDLHQSITNSTNDLDVNVVDPEAWVFR